MRLMENKKKIIKRIVAFIAIALITFLFCFIWVKNKGNGIKKEGYYYIDIQGNILNQYPIFLRSDMNPFKEDGFAFVENITTSAEKYGAAIIDKQGNVLGDSFFDPKDICVGEKNTFPILVRKSDKIAILDENFDEIGQVDGYSVEDIKFGTGFSEGIAGLTVAIEGEELYGYINTNGEWIIEPQYKDGSVFTEDGIAKVENPETELYGYVDSDGDWLNEDWFYDASDFCGGYALVQKEKDGKAAYINTKGEYITDFIFDYKNSQKGFSEGLAYVKEDGRESYGYINGQGEYILEPHYLYANEFSCGLACVNDPVDGQDREVYIDKSGKIIIEDNGMVHYTFSPDGYAIVADARTYKYGMINTKGEWLFKPQFVTEDENIFSIDGNFTNGCCIVYLKKGQVIKESKK